MSIVQKRRFDTPDETRTPPKTKVEVVKFSDIAVMKATFEPGWRWSEHVKPRAGTETCQVQHCGYILSGRTRVRMEDGSEEEFGPGDVFFIGLGHDGWTVGDEPCVMIDFQGGQTYAR